MSSPCTSSLPHGSLYTQIAALAAAGRSVLLTSYTNSAVDTVLLKLRAAGVGFLRLGRAASVHAGVRDALPGGCAPPRQHRRRFASGVSDRESGERQTCCQRAVSHHQCAKMIFTSDQVSNNSENRIASEGASDAVVLLVVSLSAASCGPPNPFAWWARWRARA